MNYLTPLTIEDLKDLLTYHTPEDVREIDLKQVEEIKEEIKKRNENK